MLKEAVPAVVWPPKYDMFGVPVSATTREEASTAIMIAAHQRLPSVVSAFAVHALVTASCEPKLRQAVRQFAIITPDGQPVKWALNWLYCTQLKHRLYGAELTWQLCVRAADEGVPIYLYGGSPQTLAALEKRLKEEFPELKIAGAESPPYRALTPEEDAAMVERVNASGAGLVFLGLGCPKQDYFAAAHVDRIQAVQLCVGAAFDFLAGTKPMAPPWMQRCGLEWIFRLYQEPGRLWKRYLVTNTIFVSKLAVQYLHSAYCDGPRDQQLPRPSDTPNAGNVIYL